MFSRKRFFYLFYISLVLLAGYSTIRLYFRLTDGFTLNNMAFNELPYRSELNTRQLTSDEYQSINVILDQSFHYLGKGCQLYVFLSDDGEYVIKFFKYQRFKSKPLLEWFSFIPAIDRYKDKRSKRKEAKLFTHMKACQIAFDNLQKETGLVYVQLNKIPLFKKQLTIYDKMGFKHQIALDQVEFLIQNKAHMFTDEIDNLMSKGEKDKAGLLIQAFIDMVLSEDARGFRDNDPALIQNTGVLNGSPIHVDVGQFIQCEGDRKDCLRQHLFDKTFKFRLWLQNKHPELLDPLNERLISIIGDDFYIMKKT